MVYRVYRCLFYCYECWSCSYVHFWRPAGSTLDQTHFYHLLRNCLFPWSPLLLGCWLKEIMTKRSRENHCILYFEDVILLVLASALLHFYTVLDRYLEKKEYALVRWFQKESPHPSTFLSPYFSCLDFLLPKWEISVTESTIQTMTAAPVHLHTQQQCK